MLAWQETVTKAVNAGQHSDVEAGAIHDPRRMTSAMHPSTIVTDVSSSTHGVMFEEDALGLSPWWEADGSFQQRASSGSLSSEAPRSTETLKGTTYTPTQPPNIPASTPAKISLPPINNATRFRARIELATAVFGLRPFVAGKKRAVRMNPSLWPAVVRSWMRREDEVRRRTLPPSGKSIQQRNKEGEKEKQRRRRGPEDGWVLSERVQGFGRGDGDFAGAKI